ncbi:MAG TPA: hypothetical protein VMO47_03225 [Rhodothermales bacterium]|nr:hypothetical protein [Rhodothermales bacterium]
MSEKEPTSTVREEFSKLSLDAKTSFLVEAVFSTAGTAISEIGDRLSNLVELFTESMQTAGSAGQGADDESPDDAWAPDAEPGRAPGEDLGRPPGKAPGKTSK